MSMSALPPKLSATSSKPSSPTLAPTELKETPSRSASLRAKADDANLPKPIARSNSKGSQGLVRRSSDAADKLASLHTPKPVVASSSAQGTGEMPVELHTEGSVAGAKLQMNEAFSEALKKHDAAFTAALEEHLSQGGTAEEFGRKAFSEGLKGLPDPGTPPEGPVVLHDTHVPDTHVSQRPSFADGIHTRSSHDGSLISPDMFPDPHTPPPGESKGMLATANDFRLRVGRNNDFQSTSAKIAASVANVTARNTLSVFLPTFARQFISMGIEAGFQHFGTSELAKAALGTVFGAAPALIAHGVGAVRDELNQTATWTSRRSRAIMAGTALAATVYEHKAGVAADNASLHMAFTIYTAMRDLLVQSNIRLDNKNTDGLVPDWKHFLTMSVAYGLDQGIVSLGMSTLASPSGPAAAKAHLSGIEQAKHAAIRAGLNLLGEIGEDLLFQSIPAIRSLWNDPATAHALELGLHTEGPTRFLANATMGPWAVRTGILATTIALTGITGDGLPKLWEKTGAKLSDEDKAKLQEATSDLIIAGVNGFLYEPFANSGSGQKQPAPIEGSAADVESQLSAGDAEHGAPLPISTYAHPNVDMHDGDSLRHRSRDTLALRERGTSLDA